jgi:hypothetical protein
MSDKKVGLKVYKSEIREHPGLLVHFQAESKNSMDPVIEEVDDYYLYKKESTIQQFMALLRLYDIPFYVVYYE